MATPDTTRSYYFYPLTQTYSTECRDGYPIYIKLANATKIPPQKLPKIIQYLGNYMAIYSVKHLSRNTKENYCSDFRAHSGTCEQKIYNFCRRHLTQREIEACDEIEERLNLLKLRGVHYEVIGLKIERGEIDIMRGILERVKREIKLGQ